MQGFWIRPVKTFQKNTSYRFEKTIRASKDSVMELNICADTRYKCYLNGVYICEGPCISDMWTRKYETVTIPNGILKDGENLLSVTVAHYRDEFYASCIKGEYPALLVFGSITDENGKREEVCTSADSGWNCFYEASKSFTKRDNTCIGLPHSETVTTEKDEKVDITVISKNDIEHGNFTPFGVPSSYLLEKRSIPFMKLYPEHDFSEIRRDETSCEIDAGAYTTAYPKFTFKGKAGEKIRFIYSECYCDPKEIWKKGRRDRRENDYVIVGYGDTVTLNGEEQSFEPFTFRAYRFVRVEYPAGTEFDVSKQSYRPYFYPIEEKGYFKTNDETVNKLWDISVNTLKCCTHETFVDCPYYEQQQYCMDSALEMMFMLRLTDDQSMARKVVCDLSRSIRPDGMVCAQYPNDQPQIIPNFSLYWILMLRDYVTYSGDMKTAKELISVADRVLTGFDALLTPEGLVGTTLYWHYTDWVDGWEFGMPPMGNKAPSTMSSMMYACALGVAATLAEDVGRSGLASEYLARKEKVIEAVNRCCYDEREGFYVDVYGYNTYSEHTSVWAVLCDAVRGDEAVALMERSFEKDISRASFSFNYYTFRAIEKTGLYKKYAPGIMEGWYKMYEIGCTTWCENPGNPRSECHGWSSAPIYEYSAMILGVKPASNGFKEVTIAPDISSLDVVSGAVPTPLGTITVEWNLDDNGKGEMSITLPKGMTAAVTLPNGNVLTDVKDGGVYSVERTEKRSLRDRRANCTWNSSKC